MKLGILAEPSTRGPLDGGELAGAGNVSLEVHPLQISGPGSHRYFVCDTRARLKATAQKVKMLGQKGPSQREAEVGTAAESMQTSHGKGAALCEATRPGAV